MPEFAHQTLALPLGEAIDGGALVQAAGFGYVADMPEALMTAYLDTFDGRVFRSGQVLIFHEKPRARILEWGLLAGSKGTRAAVAHIPRWSCDLPRGAGTLRDAIGVRVLTPVVTVHGQRRVFRIIDGLEKTVARVSTISGRIRHAEGEAEMPQLVRVEPLKGFEWAGVSIEEAITAALPNAQKVPNEFEALARVAKIDPRGYDAKLALPLEPSVPAGAAAAMLFRAAYETMVATLPGTRAGIDSEFLHDFRVAVRRSRSWLSRLKQVLDVDLLEHMKQELHWLGGVTGPVRDLDVSILLLDAYRKALPERDAGALAVLEDHILFARRRAQRRLDQALDTERFAKLIRRWPNWLTNMERASMPAAREPVITVARGVIAKQSKRVCRQGRVIDANTPAEALHALRIECKKLRYLLEAFGPLFDEAGMATLIRGLKRLQDNLGAFQDCEVQSTALREYAHEIGAKRADTIDAQLAMGRLVERLDSRQTAEREQFVETWSRFDNKPNQAFMKTAFGYAAKRR